MSLFTYGVIRQKQHLLSFEYSANSLTVSHIQIP